MKAHGRISALLSVLALLVASSGCGKRKDDSDLQRHVHLYCNLDFELSDAAKKYREIAPHLNEMTSAQRQRAEAVLMMDSIGVADDLRLRTIQDLQKRIMFCLAAHKVEGQKETDFEVRREHLLESLQVVHGPDGALLDPEATAKTLEQVRDMAQEINALPLKD